MTSNFSSQVPETQAWIDLFDSVDLTIEPDPDELIEYLAEARAANDACREACFSIIESCTDTVIDQERYYELFSFEDFATWISSRRARLGPAGDKKTEDFHKNSWAFIPVVWKSIPTKRAKANVESVSLLSADFDASTQERFDSAIRKLDAMSLDYVAYSSHGHGRDGEVRFRLVLPVTRPILPEECAATRIGLGKLIGLDAENDTNALDPARLFFLPSCPDDDERAAKAFCIRSEHRDRIDPDVVIKLGRAAAPGPMKAPAPASEPTVPREVSEVTRKQLEPFCLAQLARLATEYEALPTGAPGGYARLRDCAFRAARFAPVLGVDRIRSRFRSAIDQRVPEALRVRQYDHLDVHLRDGEKVAWYPEDRHTFAFTETGMAERLVAMHGDRFRFVEKWGKWLAWDGSRWTLDGAEALVQQAAKSTVRALYAEASLIDDDDRRKGFLKFVRACESRSARANMVVLAAYEPGIGVSHEALDVDPWVLNCANGTIDLRTGELRPHDPRDLITMIAPVEFDPAAVCPRWDRFLTEIMCGDREMIEYLSRAAGYSLTGSVREHALMFCHGGGSNGKSTLIEAIVSMMGDYAGPASAELLLASRNKDHPTEIAALYGKRLVVCSEPGENRSWNESLIKSLTGGDRIKARRMHEDFWSFAPTHKFWVLSNPEPIVHGTDDGIWRRLKKIPFLASFIGREDRELPEALRAELPGILAWAVRGCLEWLRIGLAEPTAVREATEVYRAEQDTFGQFLREMCIVDARDPKPDSEKGKIATRSLRILYEDFCREIGEPTVLHNRAFATRIRALGAIETRIRIGGIPERAWCGIRAKTDLDRAGEAADLDKGSAN